MVGAIFAICLSVAVGALAVVIVLLKREYDASPFPHIFQEIDNQRLSLSNLLDDVDVDMSRKHRDIQDIARHIRRDTFEQRLRATPIDSLADYGAKHVSWTALRRAGILTCWDLRSRQSIESLQRIRGVGKKSARRLVHARKRLKSAVFEEPITLRELKGTGLFEEMRRLAYEIYTYEQLDTHVVADARRFLDDYMPPRQWVRCFVPDRWLYKLSENMKERWTAEGQLLLKRLEELAGKMRKRLDISRVEDRLVMRAACQVMQKSNQIRLDSASILNEVAADSAGAVSTAESSTDRLTDQPSSAPALVDSDLRQTSGIQRERFTSEHSFEERVISPLLLHFCLDFERQKHVQIPTGHKYTPGFVDYVVHDERGLLTIIENKKAIPSETKLGEAADQGASYARALHSPTVVVAAPQGIWIFEVQRYDVRLARKVEPSDVASQRNHILEVLRRLRQE